ncbi:MAG: hypothetical protein M8857_02270 [marine benthic group bacterium]|nr:hypothetical protein [Gemmatimonadota bacterium]
MDRVHLEELRTLRRPAADRLTGGIRPRARRGAGYARLPRHLTGTAGLLVVLTLVLGSVEPTTAQQTRRPPVTPPELPIGRDDLIRIVRDPSAHTIEYIVGPVRLRPEMSVVQIPVQMTSLPIDGWLHGFEVAIRDGDGLPLEPGLLDHVTFVDPDDRELFSPIARRIFAAAPGTRRAVVPGLIGYPVEAGDRVLISAEFVPPPEAEIREAFLHVTFSYSLEGENLIEPRNVYPFHIDVMGFTDTRAFVVPPGRSMRAWQGSPAVEGRVLALGGHVHDFATRLRLVDVSTGAVVWDVVPDSDREGRVEGIPIAEMWWGLGRKITPDHVYRIEVEYDNPQPAPSPAGGRGEIGGIILVEKGIAWPRLDRANSDYAEDLAAFLSPRRPTSADALAP